MEKKLRYICVNSTLKLIDINYIFQEALFPNIDIFLVDRKMRCNVLFYFYEILFHIFYIALWWSRLSIISWNCCLWWWRFDWPLQLFVTGWLYELGERIERPVSRSSPPDTFTAYVTALYFTCSSLTSVGFGNVSANTNPEKIFSVCAMLIGGKSATIKDLRKMNNTSYCATDD